MAPLTITILGAGYMGSALAVVAAERGCQVRLWGTWLDDPLIEPVLQGRPHPRLKRNLPSTVKAFFHQDLAQALAGADAVVCAVNSDGVLPVFAKATPLLPPSGPLLSVTKGFLADTDGQIRRISLVVRRSTLQPAGKDRPWIAIGGPCKAMEVCRGVATAVIYAAEDLELCQQWANRLESGTYLISRSDDLTGVEACSAFKNAYATASGLCDGLQLRGQPEMFNTKAMLFAQAIHEIRRLVTTIGGRTETVDGLAGVGDLHVTAAAGRNRTFGEFVGRGQAPAQVAETMRQTGELTEGYPALKTGWDLLQQLQQQGRLSTVDFPLLTALHRIVYQDAEVASTLGAVLVREGSRSQD